MIGQETIERIRERTSIEELVGESVKLERRGRSCVGLCPFHKEKTPSFHVSEERGRYHCFGCQASGDVFRFVQETDGLSFIEAVKYLGERAGIEVHDDLSDAERKQQQAARRFEQQLYQVNAAAADFFERMFEQHPHSHYAHEELASRQLDPTGNAKEALRAFRVGYAPHGWDGLTQHLKKAGLDLRAAETVGLIASRKQGSGHYDRFRHRLMFAVLDLQGRVIAFSGRQLPSPEPSDEASPAKYINSPESPIYRKRQAVFGLYQAKTSLRGGHPAVVVEGNFDVVSLHAHGISQAVAPLGTAFTVEQGKNIRRFTSEIVFCFDGDRAGQEATWKSRDPARQADLSAKVVRLPEGTDPDEFVRAKGSETFLRLAASARGMLDYLIAELLDERFQTDDAQSRGRKVKQVLELLSSEDDPTVVAMAEQYADTLASRLGVADARTFRALKRSVERSLKTSQEPRESRRTAERASTTGEFEVTTAIIGALLDFPDLLDSEELLAYGALMQGDLAAVVACLRQARRRPSRDDRHASHFELNEALAKIPEAVRPFAEARMAAPLHSTIKTAQVELSGNLKKLQHMEFARLSNSAVNELEKARMTGDFDQELDLLRQQELRARKRRGME